MMRIESIELENVQVFEKPVHIRLAPLTFLYGPNSAGKSALEDVFKLLQFLVEKWLQLDPPARMLKAVLQLAGITEEDERLGKLLYQCKRRTSGQADAPLTMKISLSLMVSGTDNLVLSYDFYSPNPSRFKVNLIFSGQDPVAWNNYTDLDIELYADDQFLLSWTGNERRISLNFFHPITVRAGLAGEVPRLSAALECHQDAPVAFDGKSVVSLKLKAGTPFFPINSFDFTEAFHFEGMSEIEKILPPTDQFDWLYAFSDVCYRSMGNVLYGLEKTLECDVVSASRKVPEPNDLVYFLNKPHGIIDDADAQLYVQNLPDRDISHFALPMVDGDPRYKALAEACFWIIGKERGGYYLIEDEADGEQEFLDNIQRTMLDHIFVDTGYRIDYDYRLIVSPENLKRYDASRRAEKDWLDQLNPMYLRLFLRDKNNTMLDFAEVGSGLGYVLPVIVCVWDFRKMAYLQQPELHLHPALQASLGDVFIDVIKASSGRKQLIVETHSEHLLLRVLKRIRQTSSGTLLNQEQAFSSDQVAVNYFLPKGDGTTEVRHLRVSPDGDFLDRWPQGFFSERDKELFDE